MRLTSGEDNLSALETHITQLERAQIQSQDQLAEVQLHTEDLENRSCRNNLRLQGITETVGPENLPEIVRAILHRLMEPDPPAA